MNWGRVSSRTALIFVGAVALFEIGSTIVFLAAAGYSPATLNDPTRLVAVGEKGSDFFRIAALLDLFGYLSAVPLAIYLRQRFQGQNAIDFFTLAGVLFLVLGSLGAAMLAFAAAPLIHEYETASASGKTAAATAFATVYRVVFAGMWQTLDAFPAGVWLLGTGRLAWRQGAKRLALVLLAIGGAGLLFAAAHIGGFYPQS